MIDNSRNVTFFSALRREVLRKFREIGFWGTFKLCICKLNVNNIVKLSLFKQQSSDPFDLKYGTDTSGIIKPGALDIPDDRVSHAVQYQTGIIDVFINIIESLPITYEDYIFVDLGSGKGRALLLASQYPFKEIIGVELSEKLNNTACNNIKIYNDEFQKCQKLYSICEDATNYLIPKENIVFYLFNPFDEHVMRSVLSNIVNSMHNNFRVIYIAYLKPVHREVFDHAKFLQLIKETERYVIYKNKPFECV